MWKQVYSVANSVEATYLIELDRWNISKGLPIKTPVVVGSHTFDSYSPVDYDVAKNNIVGINEALKYAYDAGYRHVTLPHGEYSLCYGKYLDGGKYYTLTIYPQKDTTIDFSNSTLKVIYDSDTLSPYHDRTEPTYSCPNCGKTVKVNEDGTCPTLADPVVGDCGIHIGFWKNNGFAIAIREPNVHIENLNLIGDRVDRSFYSYNDCLSNYPSRDIRSFSEAGNEHTIGVNFANRSNGSSVTNCDIAFFMGDNIATAFQDNTTQAKYSSNVGSFAASASWGMQFGSINSTTGLDMVGTSTDVRTNYIVIPENVDTFSLIGLGYNPRTTIPKYNYTVLFYDTSNNFISSFANARTVDIVYIPLQASKIRITFSGDGTVDGGAAHAPYWMQLISNGISSNILIARNKIRGGHRGGIFLGGNNVNIEYNELISNGSTSDLYGLVMFPYMTRYGINSEDNVGQNYKINNNVFLKNRIAIAVRGEYVEISGNEFRHNDIAITLYRQYHATISQNTFLKNIVNDYPYNEATFIRDWNIVDNIFIDSAIEFSGLSPVTSIENNVLHNSGVNIACDVYSFSENTFSAIDANKNVFVAGSGIKNCSFTGNENFSIIVSGGNNITGCYFNRSNLHYTTLNYTGIVRNCKFLNSSVTFNVSYSATIPIKVYDSFFDFTVAKNVIPQGATVGVNMGYSVEFQNCKFSGLLTSAFGMQNVKKLSLYDCSIEWAISSSIPSPLCEKFSNLNSTSLTMSNCSLKSPVSITQDLVLFTDSCTLNFVNLDNFSFTTRANDIVQTGSMKDNLLQIIKIDTAIPISGSYRLSQIIRNSNPVSGGYIGWVCLTEGYANNTPWATTTPYTLGQQINTGGKVYQCTVAGTSGSTAPTHTTGTDVDGTVLTWQYLGPKAVFKPYGLIAE